MLSFQNLGSQLAGVLSLAVGPQELEGQAMDSLSFEMMGLNCSSV